jgi:tetraprenyl-beta-curcumene synthase
MSHLLNCISFKKSYTKIVYPIVNKRLNEYRIYTNRIKKYTVKSNAIEALDKNRMNLAVSSIYTFYPNIDTKLAAEVIFSYQALIEYLITICENSSNCSETFLNVIFSSLKDALNIRNEYYVNYFQFFPSKNDDGYLNILVEKCRQKTSALPSFNIIRDYVSAYLTLYIDLQVTKYFSDERSKEINLISWSSAHGYKYKDITSWEFCLSIDSPLSLELLLALATNPGLMEADVERIYNSFFPWVPGIQKILEGYLDYNEALISQSGNNVFYYKTLKEFEDRIIYFINMAISNNIYQYKFFYPIIKILLSIYSTHPKAGHGMNTLTSKSILEAGGRGMRLYAATIKTLRFRKYL